MPKPVIDQDKCKRCGTCVNVCPVQVFKVEDGKTVIDKPDDCIGCRACEAQCPAQCLTIED